MGNMNVVGKLLRTLPLFLLVLMGKSCFSQIIVVDNLSLNYDRALLLMHPYLQQWVHHMDSIERKEGRSLLGEVSDGPVYVTKVLTDTLNKREIIFKDLSGIKIIENNEEDGKDSEFEEWNNIHQDLWFPNTTLRNDSLSLRMGAVFSPGELNFIFHGKSVTGYYAESYRYDEILKLREEDIYVTSVSVPIEFEVMELSNNVAFKPGKVIYGHAIVKVKPYFIKDYSIENDVDLHLKRTYEIYFKVMVPRQTGKE